MANTPHPYLWNTTSYDNVPYSMIYAFYHSASYQRALNTCEEVGLFRATFHSLAKRYPFPRGESTRNRFNNWIEIHTLIFYPF